jgi:anti-anti-sigma regulatory factor
MSLSIQVRSDHGTVVVALAGAAAPSMLQPLRDPLTATLADAQVLVLDLDALTGVDSTVLRQLLLDVLRRTRRGHLRIATSHAATLTEARIHHLVPVHRSVADALAEEPER